MKYVPVDLCKLTIHMKWPLQKNNPVSFIVGSKTRKLLKFLKNHIVHLEPVYIEMLSNAHLFLFDKGIYFINIHVSHSYKIVKKE